MRDVLILLVQANDGIVSKTQFSSYAFRYMIYKSFYLLYEAE
jgi:hypothetical protein